ncbi:hypothetical protein TGRH88_059670 [Toxoplasma gondii]|uniref:Uncharacterized protein n=1 Tax=Toxoplasma gondii TaxID=5811 RepID=A0A7J6JV32_TOXGO|nr:hypothetical protein TGRH88_059670 [Toxoplasma gondii]
MTFLSDETEEGTRAARMFGRKNGMKEKKVVRESTDLLSRLLGTAPSVLCGALEAEKSAARAQAAAAAKKPERKPETVRCYTELSHHKSRSGVTP